MTRPQSLAVALAIAGAACLFARPARAQSANDIVERNLAAMGGRAALARLESRVASGKVTVSLTMRLDKVVHNVTIDEALFRRPAK